MYRTILALLVLTGCATLTDNECRASPEDWLALGEYDSVMGDQPWIEAYAEYCQAHGVTVAHDQQQHYLLGWEIGHAEFNRRANQTN